MKNMSYYAVSGRNGFGVYTYINGAQNIAEYISDCQITKHRNQCAAFCEARDNYNNYQEGRNIDDMYDGSYLDIQLNHVMFRNEIREINQSY